MKKRRLFAALGVVGSLLVTATVAQAQDPFLLGDAGGVEVWSVPQASPADGVDAANIVLRSAAGTKIVTFENLNIQGDVHQVWLSGPFGAPTAQGPPTAGLTYAAEWIPLDSHLLITSSMVGGGAGGSYAGITESNDASRGDLGLPPASGFPPSAGFGPIHMNAATDAFFLDTPFQSNEVNLAYLVSPAGGSLDLTLGVLGEGIVNSGEPNGAFFDALPVLLAPPVVDTPMDTYCDTSTADVCFDFRSDPVTAGAQVFASFDPAIGSGTEWRQSGGRATPPDGTDVPNGYLSITDAANGQRGVVILPDVGGGGQFVMGGRTGGANGAHHVDNLEATLDEANNMLSISAQLRVGGGTDQPADGFSFSFVRPDDPILTSGNGTGFAGIGTESDLPEEGTQTGISIGFDEWQSGPAVDPANPASYTTNDTVGISLRVDGVLLGQASLPTFNGAIDDPTSLQTGPRGPGGPGDTSELGWAQLTIQAPASGNVTLDNVVVTWKGQPVQFVPEPASGLMALMSLLSLGLLRRKNG